MGMYGIKPIAFLTKVGGRSFQGGRGRCAGESGLNYVDMQTAYSMPVLKLHGLIDGTVISHNAEA